MLSVMPESTLSARMFVVVSILRIYKITCITAVGSGSAALGQHTSVRIRGVFAFITSVVWKENVTSQCTGDRVCKFPVPGGESANPTSRRGRRCRRGLPAAPHPRTCPTKTHRGVSLCFRLLSSTRQAEILSLPIQVVFCLCKLHSHVHFPATRDTDEKLFLKVF